MEDIVEHFAARADLEQVCFLDILYLLRHSSFILQDPTLREERLYFFQFPSPFPTFLSKKTPAATPPHEGMAVDEAPNKKVAFSKDVKPETGLLSKNVTPQNEGAIPEAKIDGVIGTLEVYRSGAVKMRLANGILLDVCQIDVGSVVVAGAKFTFDLR